MSTNDHPLVTIASPSCLTQDPAALVWKSTFFGSGPSLQRSEVIQIDASPHKVKPGISSLSDDPTLVESFMNPLLESA